MPNIEHHKENTSRIISYLSYLRDISRKVVSRSGFEKCLLNRSTGYALQIDQISFELRPNDLHYKKIRSYRDYIDASNNRKLFIGFGTIAGTSKRIFAAPLLILQCEIEMDEQGRIFVEPNFYSLNLNYDFLASISTNYLNEEDGVFDQISYSEQHTIEKIEKELKDFSSLNSKSFSELSELSLRVFDELSNDIDYLKNIPQASNEAYDYNQQLKLYTYRPARIKNIKDKQREKSIFEKELVFINAHHLFVNQVPDQLSTYEALNTFVQNIQEENDFKNPVVEKLLVNALTENSIPIVFTENNEVENLIKQFVPLSLSTNQIEAIKNAWSYEISYIQGPPGTGKSHTISALILSALFLGKKVLVISQKPAALQVVNKKIEPFLSDDDNMIGISYYDKNARKRIREYCRYLLSASSNTQKISHQLRNLHQEIEEIQRKLKVKSQELKNEQKRLETALTKEKEYNDLNDTFLIALQRLNENHVKLPERFGFRKIKNEAAYRQVTDRIQKIFESNHQSIASKLFIHKFKSHLTEKFHVPNEWFDITYFPYFSKDFTELNIDYTKTQNKLRELSANTNSIRKKINNISYDISQLQHKLIKLKYKHQVFSRIKHQDYQQEIQKFDKMLYNTNSGIIDKKMKAIDFNKVTDIIPYWTAEIRHLGHLFPLKPDCFDLVVVDEASQVNLAEVLPAFYRGQRICIVGDHLQLSIKATGLTFALSASFDKLTWNYYNNSQDFNNASKKCLTVSKASILDFIKNDDYNAHIVEIMLDEHFRSLPHLARYTSREFYVDDNNPDGKLKIMTETPNNLAINCFQAIRVNGRRETETKNKFIRAEANKVIELINYLTNLDNPTLFTDAFKFPEHISKENFTIGVISMIRDQCELIKEIAEERWDLSHSVWKDYELMIGTPEEFQGNERDIMIFSLCLDTDCTRGQGHYQDAKRLNVATSRAKSFTYLVYSSFPETLFHKIFKYLRYFEVQVPPPGTTPPEPTDSLILQPVDLSAFESDFERYVYHYLEQYIQKKSKEVDHTITLHNQVKSCGQKRLDFVIYNHNMKKSVAIEVDGRYHFTDNGLPDNYTVEHINRIEILTRAGWNIINTPYHKWYKDGWLSEDTDNNFKREIERIYEEIDSYIF